MGDIQNYLPSLTTGPEVVQIIWVMSIHNGSTCRRMLGQGFLGVFTNIHLPPPEWRKEQKYLPSLTNGPEVVGMAQVMLIHDGNTCRRIPGHRFLGIFNNNHLLPQVWGIYTIMYQVWPIARKWFGWLGWCLYIMGTPAEEFLVTGSLVFSLISISRTQNGGQNKSIYQVWPLDRK